METEKLLAHWAEVYKEKLSEIIDKVAIEVFAEMDYLKRSLRQSEGRLNSLNSDLLKNIKETRLLNEELKKALERNALVESQMEYTRRINGQYEERIMELTGHAGEGEKGNLNAPAPMLAMPPPEIKIITKAILGESSKN